jgi:hypothetical protein
VKTDDTELLGRLPEVPLPAALDTLVFDRACEAFDQVREPAAPVRLPRTEALVYVAGLSAYLAVLARVAHAVAQHALRVLGG